MTVSLLSSFDTRLLTYAVTHPDGSTVHVEANDATTVVAALIPGYDALVEALEAARVSGSRRATQKARCATLAARKSHAHATRVDLQRRINAAVKADGTWTTLNDDERAELTRAATGATPTGVPFENEVWFAGQCWLTTIGIWEAPVPLVVDRTAYGLFADDGGEWTEEPTGDNVLALDPSDDEAYVASLEAVGIVTVTDGSAVA